LDGRRDFALYLQSQAARIFTIDIHPAARIGCGVFIDHGHAIVVGETAAIGDNVSMLQDVTLGGTGKEDGDRHPKIGDHVLIGAGAKILGNIRVGHGSRIAAGSVVLRDVPPATTVAGVPARIVGKVDCKAPEASMDHTLGGCTAMDQNGRGVKK
jgi:serine O-acetyltransferase